MDFAFWQNVRICSELSSLQELKFNVALFMAGKINIAATPRTA
jgi:hypothetical protein